MVVSLPLLLLLDGYYGDGNWVFLECIPCPDYRPLTIVLPLLPAIQACKKGADRPAPQGWFYSLEVTDICGCRKEKKVLGFIKIKFDKVIKITLTHDEHILFTRIIFTGYKSLTQQHASYGNACHPEQSVPSRNFVLTEITFEEAFLRNHSEEEEEEEEKQGQEEEEGKGKEKRRLEMSVRDRRTAYELVGGRSFLDLPKGAVAIVTSRARVSANSVDVDWPSIDADSKRIPELSISVRSCRDLALTLPRRRLGRSLRKVVSQTIMTTESSTDIWRTTNRKKERKTVPQQKVLQAEKENLCMFHRVTAPSARNSVRSVSFSVFKDLGQPDSCENPSPFGVEPTVHLMIPDFSLS
uniref:Uncharacterized protein n=1 Tax=Vespula pensylvanica TaxID=30213 RepID=A0A834PA69_VESPE|nr:hypothetical protein H0235_002760 [Vespula pensylvanica]